MKRLVFSLFLLGLIYRLWLAYAFPQPFIIDQTEYHNVALRLIGVNQYLYNVSHRLYGYPLILAVIYKIFGSNNYFPWIFFQALADTLSGVIVFIIGKKIFKNKTIALCGYILYLFNPYTSAYVGVRLTEIVTIFLVACTFLLFLLFIEKKDLRILIAASLIASFTPQVRPGFLYFDVVLLLFYFHLIKTEKRKASWKILSVFAMTVCFSIFFLYNIYQNNKFYGIAEPFSIDNLFAREFYISLYIDDQDVIDVFPVEVNKIYYDFSTVNNMEQRKIMENKYENLAILKVRADPKNFLLSRIRKLGYVWAKHQLFPYGGRKPVDFYTSKLNLLFLVTACTGFLVWLRKGYYKINLKNKRFTILSTLFICYISVIHAFTITAERFSLPAYPVVALFSGLGTYYIINAIHLWYRKDNNVK